MVRENLNQTDKSHSDLNHRNLRGIAVRDDKFIFNSMIKKDKIFELKIEEDDELSGIDSISLVDEPAIEVNWMFFNKEKPHEFHIPDGEDDKYIEKLVSIAQDEQELFDQGWVVDKITIVGENEFVSTNPNGPSIEDEKEYNVRYKYILNPRITGQRSVIPTTRDFCRSLLSKNLVWRVEDMEKTQNDFGDSAMVWRGGFNCRHVWSRIEYKKDATIVNKASVNKGKVTVAGFPTDMIPDTRVMGMDEPSTVTSKTLANPSASTKRNLGLSKEKFEVGVPHYTEDGKLYEGPTHKDASGRLMTGAVHTEDSVYLYHADELSEILIVCKECGHSWDTEDGGDKPYMCNICGYDNTSQYDMGYDVGGLPSFVDPDIKKKRKDIIEKSLTPPTMFESHSDYPESVKNNAKAVLKWVDENGWGSCGTDVGKQRANQLAKGEPISEETIRRMYSYLSRHAVDLESSKGYDDGCGKLMYDSWGGKTALSWAESKVNAMDKEKMSKQRFQTDDEKRIVLGPAMIPDAKIYRKDSLGNPYYVYFSSDTIKMIAEKYMRNKYTDNNDEMHNGKAVSDVYVVESWIKESENDKSTDFGYGDLPVGTWFVSMKVRNDETWVKVKEGKLNGFSVSGYFEEVAAFCREEMFLQQVAEILKNIKD